MAITDKKVLNGARVRISIDGKPVGFGENLSISSGITWARVKVIGNIETKEHVPDDYNVSGSLATFYLVDQTLKSQGFAARLGTSAEEHLQNLLNNSDLAMMLEDAALGNLLGVLEGVKFGMQNMRIGAQGVVGFDVSFEALRFKDIADIA